MSTRKPSPQSRSVRPAAEALEDRQMLSAVISSVVTGTDPQGDHWTLKLIGPGTLNVSQPDGTPFTAATANTPAEIGTITVSGTDAIESRLVGTVAPAAGSDGRVFFQFLRETGGGEQPQIDPSSPIGAKNPVQPKNGILAINMPNFWLGNTPGTVPTPPAASLFSSAPPALAGAIDVPDGVSTLDFGGVEVRPVPPRPPGGHGAPQHHDSQDDQFQVNLGTPVILGTSIIINRSISDSEPGVTRLGHHARPASPTQDAVYFAVAGRVNLFQANEILGNTTNAPTQFTATAGATTGTTAGGTYLISGTGSPPFFIGTGGTTGALTGQIGNVRIGGNATNFTTMVYDNSAGNGINSFARIANFSIGGETQNILVLAPNGLRNVYFGEGMDETQINAYVIQSLSANRGAIGSNVDVSRGINSVNIGGDVVETNIQSGYDLTQALVLARLERRRRRGTAIPTVVNRLTNHQRQLPVAPGDRRRPHQRPDRRQRHELGHQRIGRAEPELRRLHLAGHVHAAEQQDLPLRLAGQHHLPARGHQRQGRRHDRQLQQPAGRCQPTEPGVLRQDTQTQGGPDHPAERSRGAVPRDHLRQGPARRAARHDQSPGDPPEGGDGRQDLGRQNEISPDFTVRTDHGPRAEPESASRASVIRPPYRRLAGRL